MHIIIGIITAIAGLVWALHSLQNSGVNLNSFNPFHWVRRRNWEKQLGTKPMHRLDKPMDAACLLLVGIVKTEGEITREQKSDIIKLFQDEFNLDQSHSAELFSVSSHMLQDVIDLPAEVINILAPCKEQFKPEQTDSLLKMLAKVASIEHAITDMQSKVITAVEGELRVNAVETGKWT